jgi:hypothetical protein
MTPCCIEKVPELLTLAIGIFTLSVEPLGTTFRPLRNPRPDFLEVP